MALSQNSADDLAHDRLLTTGEVGEMLGLSSEAVLRRWRAGELPGFRLSSRVLRFRESEVLAWLEARRVGPRLGIVEVSRAEKESDDAG